MKAKTRVQATSVRMHRLPKDISVLQRHNFPKQDKTTRDEARICMEGVVHEVLNTLQRISLGLDCLNLPHTGPDEYQFLFQQVTHASRVLREGRDHFCRLMPQHDKENPAAVA